MKSKSPSASTKKFRSAERGFSLIELLIVVSIIVISAAVAIPTMATVIRMVRLNGAGSSYADLLQQARIRAVRDDKYYSVVTTAPTTGMPATAFLDLASSGSYAAGDPRMTFPEGVAPLATGSAPGVSALKTLFLPSGTTAQNSVNTTAPGPTFGPRGLPCNPVTASGYTTCLYQTPTSFMTFLQNSEGGAVEAVTVTPAGRIREWSYTSSAWTPLN
jgi:prepilin-type N-terminal cleavage/methylation domain-containing protein